MVPGGAFAIVNTQRHGIGYLSGCQSLVAVMQTTELRKYHNLPGTGRLNGAGVSFANDKRVRDS